MTCREVKGLLRKEYSSTLLVSYQIKSHARSCSRCNQELAINNLMSTLVTCYGNTNSNEHSLWDDAQLANSIKSRIQAISQHRAGSWDTAIIGIKGWLLAFGAMAVLLLALSSQFAVGPSLDQPTSDKTNRSSSNWNEELVSTNSYPNLLSEEDLDNAH